MELKGAFKMKRTITFFVILALCVSMFSTTVFASEIETSTDMSFTAGSAGMFYLDENNVEHFISADEILAYNALDTVALPSNVSSNINLQSSLDPTSTKTYTSIVRVEAKFYYPDKEVTRYSTGAFIGPSGILTCAHGIYDREYDLWASEVSVKTMYSTGGSYDNKYYKKQLFIGGEYKDTNLDDWGIITINESSKVGYYGFRSAESASDVDRLAVTLVGFIPEDEDENDHKLVKSDGVLKASSVLGRELPHVYSSCKVKDGMSGGPYLENTTYVRGIVTREHNIESQGLLINNWLYNALYEYSGRKN